jgi:predicted Zn-dependent peptidase
MNNSILSSMISNHTSENKQQIDAASEIRKFKELLEDGIISAEEFEDKKKQLLEL